jgi:phosphoserine phosphatase RsbU/P
MPILHDWAELGRATIRSLKREDVQSLYSHEWKAAKEKLVSGHRKEIEGERKRWKRFLRTANAIVYGLAQRLTPARRALFLIALVFIVLSLLSFQVGNKSYDLSGARLTAYLLLSVLLGMELVDKIQFRDELVLARELQANLIPKKLPADGAFDLGAYNHIANMVGGDVYDFVPLADGRLAVLFGDASGHGMAAGLVMAVAHAGFRTQLDADPSAAAMIPALNRLLCRTGGPRSFFSCVYLLASPDGSFSITVAGHPQVLKIDGKGAIRDRFGKGSYPLGIKLTLLWQAETGSLAAGETLLLYSDGLVEARNLGGEEFGDGRLEGVVRLHSGYSATDLTTALATELSNFCGPMVPEDDVSIAAIKRKE